MFKTRSLHLTNTVRKEHEEIVQNGLALTPSQMMDLTNRGVPITPANLGLQYDEGYNSLEFDTTLENTRGVDITDMWEHREDMKKRVKSDKFKNLITSKENVQ